MDVTHLILPGVQNTRGRLASRRAKVYRGGCTDQPIAHVERPGLEVATTGGYLRRLTRRLTEDLEQVDAEKIGDDAAATGAQRVIDCQRGQEVTMCGTLRTVETNSKGCVAGVKAELFDGTDTVMLVWLGQRRIPGIESGRTLLVRGRLGKLENGGKVIHNPYYEIQR